MEQMGETPPNMNDGNLENNDETPPEKPEGENNDMVPPEMPNTNNNMTPPDMDNGTEKINPVYYVIFGVESLILSILIIYLFMSKFNNKTFKETFENSDKKIIYILSIIILTGGLTFAEYMVTAKMISNNEVNISEPNKEVSYSSSHEITASTTKTSGKYESKKKDENALLVSGDIDVDLSNIEVTKMGDSNSGDNTSFYGINSAIIGKNGANLILKDITVTTNANGSNGVFSYGGSATNNSSGDGTNIEISNSKITTTKDNSGGIMTTGGGTMVAKNLTINTSGVSSAAIRTDRGGGTVLVDGGTYTTTGAGSPSIYSTADITVKNANLISKSAEGIVIEGKNKVSLENTNLTATNNSLNGQSTTYKNIFLYQSMSGDALTGTSEFSAKDSNITTNKGDTFYITNTNAKITLINNKIVNNDSTGYFLRAQKDSWGQSDSNGGDVTLSMTNQQANGEIAIDALSTLDMTLTNNSYYEGTINNDNSAKYLKITLDKTSRIKLTGDSYINELDNADRTNSNIDFNGYKLYVNKTVLN